MKLEIEIPDAEIHAAVTQAARDALGLERRLGSARTMDGLEAVRRCVEAWAGSIAFGQAVRAAVAKVGPEVVERAAAELLRETARKKLRREAKKALAEKVEGGSDAD